MTNRNILLTKLELSLAQIVWGSHPEALTVREIVERFNRDSKKELAYNTVQTMMTILKDKGVVTVKPGPGRAHLYQARLSQSQVSNNMVTDLVDRLFEGRPQALLMQLMESESLGKDELHDLRQWIDQRLQDRAEEE